MKQIGMIASLVSVLAVSAPVAASADNIERIGDVLQLASPAYALYLSNSLNSRAGLSSCGKAIGTTFLATHALKYAIDAPRPNGGGKGFPSGHTSSAAVGFGCVLGQEGMSTAALTLGAATLFTGYSRVESDHHTWEQVGAGFALGTAIGYFSTRHLAKGQRLDYDMAPDGTQSLAFSFDF